MSDFSQDGWTLTEAAQLFADVPCGCWRWNTECGESIHRDCAVEFFRDGTGRFLKFHIATQDSSRLSIEGTFTYEQAGKGSIRVRLTSPAGIDGQSAVVNYAFSERRSAYGGRVLQIVWTTPELEPGESFQEAWPFSDEMDWVRTG